ncbi:MAG: 50S ribosomal protein L25 [Candidatus Moranbacteria bacterium]|nr:50S ribosomal protein L25 [Candidatus Moranbacteria bacterium]PIP25972.1 MAG: 50S ribosomal protein L25 [Candidatus Moranbacteria bacterium CG23_combo_of_CG06-09_8_20_14_all_41_28]PIV86288.1 MAG: 50S ribosomal protein L25 [Candidatus Moranbacteria bacterium CG17_big_fil_post_rev_8_21_14_2_50_41_107]PIW94097.1 MAG: 50S ribosomal protein L25 [Candidatus Moranbacteria bacterium CG_4_8_14_3_um_filter_41_13]PJC00118.1 MAG: 50S ribosomal protein L25 [Candidatus Moranbacteria bacterium CG_4_9_14_0_
MAEFTLAVKTRDVAGKDLFTIRKQGFVPAVLYGHKTEAVMFWVNYIAFAKLYAKAGESSIIELDVEKGKKVSVIIQDIQTDPLSNRFSHIDLFQVRMDEKLEAHIPLEFVGEAPAVREMGGMLLKPVEELFISCLPKDLPHSLSVDLSSLKTFEDHIQVKDMIIPAGVEVLTEMDTTVALVEAPRSEAEMEALNTKVEGDVTKVEGVVKETAPVADAKSNDKKDEKKK